MQEGYGIRNGRYIDWADADTAAPLALGAPEPEEPDDE